MPIKIHQGFFAIPYEHKVFSGGEVHVKISEDVAAASVVIRADLRAPADVMLLLLLTDALRRANVSHMTLEMPYLPYARQDRVCSPGEALSLRVFCDLINAQRYDRVRIWDAHSDTALALLNSVVHVPSSYFVSRIPFKRDSVVLVAPDAGAIKKVAAAAKDRNAPFVRADKTRDPDTGAITGTVVYSEHIGPRDFLIVDDICDGGRTFMELAKVLRPLTDGKVNLYVTHGIFSYGTAVLGGLDNVFVANSFVDDLPANFHIIE